MRGPCQLIFVVVIAFLTGCAAVREVGQRGVVIEDRSSTVAVRFESPGRDP